MKLTHKITISGLVTSVLLGLTSVTHAQFNIGGIQFSPSISRRSHSQTADLPPRGPGYTIGSGGFRFQVDPRPYVVPPTPRRSTCQQPAPIGPITGPVVPVEPVEPVAPPQPMTPEQVALALTYEAQEHFKVGNYPLATETMNRVIELSPDSSAAYQFRALTYFARGNYDAAAADIYDTLLRGNLWNWETVYPLYGNEKVYTAQYRQLSRSARTDAQSLSKHFLLAYHHLVLGHLSHGEKELKHVLTIRPTEELTQKLLVVVQRMQSNEKVAQR